MSIRLQLPKVTDLKPRITVLGVGGAGGNAINNMIAAGLQGVDFVVANTDAQALATSSAENRIQLGTNLTEGMGAGSKPEIGEAAAEEAVDDIRAQVAGSHMLFIAAGMGGGTGTGAAAVIARVARELGILTVAVVTKPFQFEGNRRLRIAEAGIHELKDAVDTLIVIPNQNLFRIANERTTFAEAFVLADQVLYSGIACIVDLIIKEGLINLDLADVKTVLAGMGGAMMGTGEASGEDRARLAAEEAIHNPLLDDISLKGAKGLLVSIIGGHDLTLYEVDAAASRVRQEVDPDANIIVGATFDESLGDRIRVSIVASGMARSKAVPAPAAIGQPSPFALNRTSGLAGFEAVTGQQSTGKTPPPLPGAPSLATQVSPSLATPPTPSPTSQPPSGSPSDLQRRLADALEPGSGFAAPFDGQLSASAGRSHEAPANPVDTSSNGIRTIGGITLEERSPQFAGYVVAPAVSNGGIGPESAYEAIQQEKRPTPSESKSPRRVTDLSDFQPMAQHEYRPRSESYVAAPGTPKPPKIYSPSAETPEKKKTTLFQRITGAGRVRKANADDLASPPLNTELPGFLARNKR